MKYRYNVHKGITRIKTKFDLGKSLLGFVALVFPGVLALSTLGAAAASPPSFGLQPFEFVGTVDNCGSAGTDTVTAEWTNSDGNPAPSILLQKLGATSNCAAAGVDIISSLEGQPVSNLAELNFDFKDGGHCGSGAPRFNLELNGTNNAFLGCNSTLGTKTPSSTTGWTHVEFSTADIAAAVVAAGGSSTDTLSDLYIIFDEGSDTGPDFTGTVNIDNISVNNQVVGSPTSASSKDDCKNNGWQSLLGSNGQPFKNQGQCVSSANHNNGKGKDDVKVKQS
jgi:hypothetical protein